ncbi:hypothetical protein FC50_GL001540 [Lacticaseibacillus pantheris DSM 15945 = JCM 12539 = NBRC 106106]|uniref:HTH hxlR-type domain-containing protein n=2 Tax=Lacticaseibacillus pantheris TaxID=171523 RepID=A0A0R1TW15_9LACO|nr:hypothetical protein FC50_GL001540 [Lacticaseibacillus pantheris DSM 15945 = JCM 12539 = NBRC 106106]
MLALQLHELIADGIVLKHTDPGNNLVTDYQLSAFGETLTPVIAAMETWGNQYNAVMSAHK